MAVKKSTMIYCTSCGWEPDQSLTRGGQYQQLKKHWRENEFNNNARFRWYQDGDTDQEELMFQQQTGTSIILQLWSDIDEITRESIPIVKQIKLNEAEGADPLDIALQRLDLASKSKTGRGLAIALFYMSRPYFDSADEVVKHAVKRYKANLEGESVFTPGTGSGFEADQQWLKQKRGEPVNGSQPAPAQPVTPVQPAPVQPAPVPSNSPAQPAPGKIDPDTARAIAVAVQGGFAARDLAPVYGVTEAELNAVIKPYL